MGTARGLVAAHGRLSPCGLTSPLLSPFPIDAGFWGAREGGYPPLAVGAGGALPVPSGGWVLCSSSQV